MCDVEVQEEPDIVWVRIFVCRDDELEASPRNSGGRRDRLAEERVHVDLDRPLGSREVRDAETGDPVPFYVPTWRDNRPLVEPGFYTDADEAAAAARPRPEGAPPATTRHDAPWPLRTLGY